MKKKPYAVIAFVIAYIIYALLTSCSAELAATLEDEEIREMENMVNRCEAELDSLDRIMPLSDTVGETDTYCDMRDAFNAFQYSRTIEGKRENFGIYLHLQEQVVTEAKDWLANRAQYE